MPEDPSFPTLTGQPLSNENADVDVTIYHLYKATFYAYALHTTEASQSPRFVAELAVRDSLKVCEKNLNSSALKCLLYTI